MKNKIKCILLFAVAICLFALPFASELRAVTADWNDFHWEKAIVTPSNIAESSYWLEFYFLPDNPKYGFACGSASSNPSVDPGTGVFAKTSDGGKTWQASYIPLDYSYFHAESIIFIDTMVGYASGSGSKPLAGTMSLIIKTLDGGKTWNEIAGDVGYGVWGCYAIGNKIWVATGSCDTLQDIYISTNGGGTFAKQQPIKNSLGNHITDFKMYDADKLGYCIGSGKIFRTLNGGKDWDLLNETPEINWTNWRTTNVNWHEDLNIYNRSVIIPMSPGCDGGESRINEMGALGFSPDLGATWNTFKTNGNMFGTFILDETSGWGCGIYGEVYFTQDAGRNWTLLNCGIEPGTYLDDLWFTNDTTGFVGGGGGIYRLVRHQQMPIEITGDTVNCGDKEAVLRLRYYDLKASYYWWEIKPNGDTTLIATNQHTVTVGTSGSYYVEVIGNENRCNYGVSRVVHIQIDKAEAPVVEFDNKTTFCSGIDIPLQIINATGGNSADSEWTSIKWYLDNAVIDSNKTSIIPAKTGEYHVEVRSKVKDCLLISNKIKLTIIDAEDVLDITENEAPFFVDSVKYGMQGYRSFKITNNGKAEFTIRNIGLEHKNCFTIPMWQFPLTIPPGASHDVIIYYTPTNINLQTDTLYIEDYCSTHNWSLAGFGSKNLDTTDGTCEVAVAISTHSIKKTIGVFLPYPNPAGASQPEGRIGFSITTDSHVPKAFANLLESSHTPREGEGTWNSPRLPTLMFYNALGQPVDIEWQASDIVQTNSDGRDVISGDLRYNLQLLPAGVYFIQLSYYSYNKVFSVIKE